MHLHLDMGRYAAYVWPSYAISAAVLAWMVWDSLARAARWRRAAQAHDAPAKDEPGAEPRHEPGDER
jgi:heme exporter protein D